MSMIDSRAHLAGLMSIDKSTLPADGGERFNRLIFAGSPYLLTCPTTVQANVTLTIDPGFPGFNPDRIAEACEARGIPHLVLPAPIDTMVRKKPEITPCAMCSRLRRGVMYSFAKREGYTKIALGHHLDDLIETLLLNQFYEGRLSTMPVKLTSDDGANTVIRPMAYIEEEDLRRFAWLKGYPIVPCGCPLCGASTLESKRAHIKALIAQLRLTAPDIKFCMLNAMKNVKTSHLLDQNLLGLPEEYRK